jgi:hypothetical protein
MVEYEGKMKEKILERNRKCMTVSKYVPYLLEYKMRIVFLVHLPKNGDYLMIMHKVNTFCKKAVCFCISHGYGNKQNNAMTTTITHIASYFFFSVDMSCTSF